MACIRVQNPIQLGPNSVPEPDLALVALRRYRSSHPTPGDTFLVIEVADSSLDFDRNVKFPMYAAANIPEAWLVDLNGRAVERHSGPQGRRYTQIVRASHDEFLASLILPSFAFSLDEALGSEESD